MKKLISSLVLSLFAVSTIGNTVFASSEDTQYSTEILTEIEDVANNSRSIELIDVDELPEGTPIVNFDTVEDFEKALKELDEENKDLQVDVFEDTKYIFQSDQFITTFAGPLNDRITVFVKTSLNPLKAVTQPVRVTVDLKYTYTGSGSSKKFSNVSSVKSFSSGFPTDWVQTSHNRSYFNSNKGVKIKLFGYNVVGAVIKGQPIGAKIADEITFSYTLGGSKNIFAN
ncbi:hypothetical protein MKY34_00800 [Sporosarcina sp. FSL K6-1522]|uniref:hypothetical protein n=1 Tax=Sporosarcina sp. FSL K6-1522 TaxID=2921554 RepID=UPI0031599F5B